MEVRQVEGGNKRDWFNQALVKRVGDRRDTFFWKDKWAGDDLLLQTFPRLFSLAVNKEAKIGETGEWVDERWCWKWDWRREFFGWEEELFLLLQVVLEDNTPVGDIPVVEQ